MKKRILALLTALFLLCGFAFAQSNQHEGLYYKVPVGWVRTESGNSTIITSSKNTTSYDAVISIKAIILEEADKNNLPAKLMEFTDYLSEQLALTEGVASHFYNLEGYMGIRFYGSESSALLNPERIDLLLLPKGEFIYFLIITYPNSLNGKYGAVWEDFLQSLSFVPMQESTQPLAEDMDLSEMTTDQLIALRKNICMELIDQKYADSFVLHTGEYIVGEDLHAGTYLLSGEPNASVVVGYYESTLSFDAETTSGTEILNVGQRLSGSESVTFTKQ